ncbi:MAG: hypothetical protein J6Z14_07475 [Prevotella sp.]|nr:hypothetical protein [Prevotella sp.]
MKHITILLIFTLLILSVFAQQTFFINSNSFIDGIVRQMPIRDVEIDDEGVSVTYTFNNVIIQPNFSCPGTYFLKLDGFGQCNIVGQPCVPMRWDSFTIPDNKNYDIIVTDSESVEIPIVLPPAIAPQTINSSINHAYDSAKIIPYFGFSPLKTVFSSSVMRYGNVSLLSVCVCPIQFDLQNKKAKVYKRIRYRVNYNNRNLSQLLSRHNYKNDQQNCFLSNTTLNYSFHSNSSRSCNIENEGVPLRKDYFIISITEYESAVRQFAEWKKKLGFVVHIRLKARGEWNCSDIKSEVNEMKDSFPTMTHFLIIGDHQDVPAEIKHSGGSHATDYYYCNTTSTVSTIENGRLPVSSLSEATTVVNKIINYEKMPVVTPSFYSNALCCAFFQDGDSIHDPRRNDSILKYIDMRHFVQTAEEVRNHLILQGKNVKRVYYAYPGATPKYFSTTYSFGEEMPLELQKPNFMWEGDCWDINDTLNAGVFCAIHNDHGHPLGWRDPWYHSIHVSNYLHNGDKLPVVFSMNCESGMFNGTTCFAETMLRKENGGCVGIFAASANSYSGYTDALTEGMIDAIWPQPSLIPIFPNITPHVTQTPEPTYRLGQILKQGLKRMEETYHSSLLMKEIFHCLGDPSMQITTEVPTNFSGATVIRNSNNIIVQTGGEEATISFYDRRLDSVACFHGTSAEYFGRTDCVSVCVSAHNKIPFIDEEDIVFLQNEILTGTNNIEADIILVGEHVTDMKSQGVVTLESGSRTSMSAQTIEINSGTTVKQGAELEIGNNTR